jgi:DNA-binding MarR family transcriptional regulator
LEKAGLHGMMHTHCAILYALYASKGSMRMTDIAMLINRTKPTVSVLVDFLQKKEYIEKYKSADDSRETLVQLTHKGYEIQKTIEAITKKLKRIAFKNFKKSEIDMLVALLSRLQENLR